MSVHSTCRASFDVTVSTWLYADFMLLSVSLYTLAKGLALQVQESL
ncbi:TPA: hypothetical protein NV629_004306 [Escherichia coli]|nr:hypothetical protein [Escherichia coli]